MAQHDADELDRTIDLLWLSEDTADLIDLLHQLLLVPHHWSHQQIARELQRLRHASSVPFIRAALETNFDYLAYSGSRRSVIAKWFSWALHDIGTPEAIQTMREFAETGRKGIRKEMRYRLSKING
ncbi:hypothetical protein [Hymenobacter sp. CRA2]|uniref:hypothetical protein n=1 Tax=Hymenobacter sp. CRA2 TaxID=1955620 RepID=UPI00098FA6B5|nr:hypothetical protein [Hymenobacter sp. CRA2]OON69359.1 hypothetical protein B0919_08725 [Hymenobacter sp. CRA2]